MGTGAHFFQRRVFLIELAFMAVYFGKIMELIGEICVKKQITNHVSDIPH